MVWASSGTKQICAHRRGTGFIGASNSGPSDLPTALRVALSGKYELAECLPDSKQFFPVLHEGATPDFRPFPKRGQIAKLFTVYTANTSNIDGSLFD